MSFYLFKADETRFENQGLGKIQKYKNDVVTEERNGQFYLELSVFKTDKLHDELKNDRHIMCNASHDLKNQIFKIVKITKSNGGSSSVYAEHISYIWKSASIKPFVKIENLNAGSALEKLRENLVGVNRDIISTYSNISTISSTEFKIEDTDNARRALGGQQGSILQTYKGEYKFDNYKVSLLKARGSKRNVVISYGKNLKELTQDEDIESVYTSVYPYARVQSDGDGEDRLITLKELFVDSSLVDKYSHRRVLNVDFSSDNIKNEEQLKKRAERYIKDNDVGIPKINMNVNYLDLSKTIEYDDIDGAFEPIGLCDILTVRFPSLGIDTDIKVIKTTYSPSMDRYINLELGEAKFSLSDSLGNLQSDIEKIKDMSLDSDFVKSMIKHQTDLITGNKGGNMIIRYSSDGKPNELLFMDSDNVSNAKEVLRINRKGIGFSKTGYNGPFDTAWTLDGKFNASFINAGVLKGIYIELSKKMTVEEGGFLTGSYDYKEVAAVEPRTFYGDWVLGKRDLQFSGVTTKIENNVGAYTDTTFGQDTVKFRQYSDSDHKNMVSRIDITAFTGAQMTVKNFYGDNHTRVKVDGGTVRAYNNDEMVARFSTDGNIWAKEIVQGNYLKGKYITTTDLAEFKGNGIATGRINTLSGYDTFQINSSRGDLGGMTFGKDGDGPYIKSIDIWNRDYLKGEAIVVSTAKGTIGSSRNLLQQIERLAKLEPLIGLGKVAIATGFNKKDGTVVSWFDITL